ncbi:hypothetical protein B0J12DRAFT_703814 [Macrophomina phaseolina]|uniref:Defect at low temperature protein 1 n=1 Tax=Macrophomina phaseolina TaxID=35725 RepID=A0ABQ8FX68_9PEZI|nr:hypothetical protein B0J12DRAFT_703814 [Macrophomina phaseolina]
MPRQRFSKSDYPFLAETCTWHRLRRSAPFILLASLLVFYGALRATQLLPNSALAYTFDVFAVVVGFCLLYVAVVICAHLRIGFLLSQPSSVERRARRRAAMADARRRAEARRGAERQGAPGEAEARRLAPAGERITAAFKNAMQSSKKLPGACVAAVGRARGRVGALWRKEREQEAAPAATGAVGAPVVLANLHDALDETPIRIVDFAYVRAGAPLTVRVPGSAGAPPWQRGSWYV